MAEARGVFIQYFPERGLYYQKRDPSVCDEYEGRVRYNGTQTGQPLSAWIERPPLKLLCLGAHEALVRLREEMAAAFPQLRLMFSCPTYLEIVAGEVDKGGALRTRLRLTERDTLKPWKTPAKTCSRACLCTRRPTRKTAWRGCSKSCSRAGRSEVEAWFWKRILSRPWS